MVRWRYCLVLALLMLLPTKIDSKLDEDDEDDHNEDSDEEEDDDDDEEEEELDKVEKPEKPLVKPHLRVEGTMMTTIRQKKVKRPLECFVCTYKKDMPLKSCLDPMKFRVHTITCHSLEDKCFTAVVPKGNTYESVLRGCRSGCVGTHDTTCCELNQCNSQTFAIPEPALMRSSLLDEKETIIKTSSAANPVPPTVLFFVSVLLLLQTVVRVAFV